MQTHIRMLYEPLSAGNIRLLRLDANLSTAQVGSLIAVDIDTAPPYYALSHTWVNQNEAELVESVVGGQTLSLSLELSMAIQQIRALARLREEGHWILGSEIEYVWIDSICINQGDILERAIQVQKMGIIYSYVSSPAFDLCSIVSTEAIEHFVTTLQYKILNFNRRAVRTLIWLGPGFGSSSECWHLVDRIYHCFTGDEKRKGATHDDHQPPQPGSSSHLNWANESWARLDKLFRLRWFSRIWTLQEVVLSKADPIIINGPDVFPWNRLATVASWLRQQGYVRTGVVPESVFNVDMIGLLRCSATKWPLEALISVTQTKYQSSDQRDKVYSLLGLAADCQDISTVPRDLFPDYGISVKQVYLKVSRYLIKKTGSLALLSRTRGTDGSLTRRRRQYDFYDFPSWLPDWSDFSVRGMELRRSLSWIDYSDVSKPAQLAYPKTYNASAGLPAHLHDCHDSEILRIGALKVDRIAKAYCMNKDDVANSEFIQRFASVILRICWITVPLIVTDDLESWAEKLIRVSSADQPAIRGREPGQCLKDGMAYLLGLVLGDKDLRDVLPPSTVNQLLSASKDGDPEIYAAEARHFCFNRSFFVTSAGRMGIGPSDTRLDDVVAVLPGSGVPFVIRSCKKAEGWLIVGESYVDGLMRGEAIQSWEQGRLQEEVLEFH